MIFRGSMSPVASAMIDVDERPFADEGTLRADFDDARMLYFPLPFGEEYASFVNYSLSTKLVTYLGSGVPILYHGPRQAAAAKLLKAHDAAVIVDSLAPGALVEGLRRIEKDRNDITERALALGQERFRLEDQQATFWQGVQQALGSHKGS